MPLSFAPECENIQQLTTVLQKMISFCTLLVLVLMNPCSACVDDKCREMEFPSHLSYVGKRLTNHVIKTITVTDQESCELQCYLDHNCVSINFQFLGTHQNCDLNNATRIEHRLDFKTAQGYFYRGTENACGREPCKNNATCQFGFTSKRYRCLCTSGFTGQDCEIEFSINSTILSNNEHYLRHLYRFVEPAVGHNSHWLLCFRASFHGIADEYFHKKCDGNRDTITIIRVKEYVFGGYVDIPWESPSSEKPGYTPNAFIFSLHNSGGRAFKSKVTNPEKATYNHIYLGPTFGFNDIRIDRSPSKPEKDYQSSTNFGTDYLLPQNVDVKDRKTILAGTYHFKPDEVEVFYLNRSQRKSTAFEDTVISENKLET